MHFLCQISRLQNDKYQVWAVHCKYEQQSFYFCISFIFSATPTHSRATSQLSCYKKSRAHNGQKKVRSSQWETKRFFAVRVFCQLTNWFHLWFLPIQVCWINQPSQGKNSPWIEHRIFTIAAIQINREFHKSFNSGTFRLQKWHIGPTFIHFQPSETLILMPLQRIQE